MRTIISLFLILALCSCTDPKDNPELTTYGKVTFELKHFWGSYDSENRKEFTLGESLYTTDRKDTLKLNSFEYQIREIAFRTVKGGVWKDSSVFISVDLSQGALQSIGIDSVNSGTFDLVQFYLTDVKFNGERLGATGNKVITYDLSAVENDRLFSKETEGSFEVSENISPKIQFDINVSNIWEATLDLGKNLDVNGASKEAASAASYFSSGWLLEHVDQ